MGQVILSDGPFSKVLAGRADVADVGDDRVISAGLGSLDLGGALFNDRKVDRDGDGQSDLQEESTCPDPLDSDSDDDGLADGIEDLDRVVRDSRSELVTSTDPGVSVGPKWVTGEGSAS